jgi:hypothetical protein
MQALARRRGDDIMILGLFDLTTYTILHVIISLVAIIAGFIVMVGMLGSQRMPGCTAAFLTLTVLTSLTGFGFPFSNVTPAQVFGVISLVVLLVAILAYYQFRLSGAWRWLYVASAFAALWLNVFVLIVQAFQKVSFFRALAPTQSEPPFLVAQGVALVLIVIVGIQAIRNFHPAATTA